MSNPFSIQAAPGWCDITDTIDASNVPYTLALEDGIGAFQISAGIYRKGPKPNPSAQLLLSMLLKFATAAKLGVSFDVRLEDSPLNSPLKLAAASFEQNNGFVRVWYVSDGYSFAQVTYVSDINPPQKEVSDCEIMVRTLRFNSGY